MATHNVKANIKKVKANIETALGKLAGEFNENPYRFLNESDAVNHFCRFFNADKVYKTFGIKECNDTCKLKQDAAIIGKNSIGLIHTEYPNFSKNRKFTGRYDIAILNDEFIEKSCPEHIVRPNEKCGNIPKDQKRLDAVIEFKLGKSAKILRQKGQTEKVLQELDKNTEAELRYYVFFMRYQGKIEKKGNDFTFLTKKGNHSKLQENWENTCQVAGRKNNVQSIFVFYLPNTEEKNIERRFGNWNKK